MSLLSRLPAGLLLACALLLSVPARAEPSVTQYFHDLQSLQAGFTQRVSDAQGRLVQESAGSMAMQKPGRFRWDYTAPSPQTIVADGQRLWVHDPGLDQVTVRPLDAALGGTPLALLSGAAPIEDVFKVGPVQNRGGLSWYLLTPKDDGSDFKALRVGFRGDALAALELEDALGGRTRVEFSHLQRNGRVDPAQFRFTPPPGTDVIGDAG